MIEHNTIEEPADTSAALAPPEPREKYDLMWRSQARKAPLHEAVLHLLLAASMEAPQALAAREQIREQLRSAQEEWLKVRHLSDDKEGPADRRCWLGFALEMLDTQSVVFDRWAQADTTDEDIDHRELVARMIAKGVEVVGTQTLNAWIKGKPLPSTKQTQVPAIVRRSVVSTSNCQGDRDLQLALAQRGRDGAWQTNENEATKYFQGKEMSVIYQPDELLPEAWWVQDREVTLEALNQRFASIRNDMTADIVDLMFHHWWNTKKPDASASGVEKTFITLRQICEYRGITPNKHNIEAAYQSMRDVRAFQLKGGAISEKLFDISTVEMQPTLWGQDSPPHADTAFVYSPGYFLSKAVAGERAYLAPFMAKVWELDPYRDAQAKRLARYLRGEWRLNMGHYLRPEGQTPTRWRTWASVLEAAGINFEGFEATKKPARFIAGIHDAINTLCACGAIFEGKDAEKAGDWIYHPEDRPEFVNLARQGAFARWLNLRVCIDPPAEMRDALREPQAKRAAWDAAVTQEQARQSLALPAGKKRAAQPRKKSLKT